MNWGYWGSIGVVASQEYRERMAQVGVDSIEPEEALEALEHLLAGPVDQMALLKTTKPVASGPVLGGEMIQADERMTIYPELLPSCIRSLWMTARDCPYSPTGDNTNPNPDVRKEPIDIGTQQGMPEMEELLFKLLWSHLQSLGLFREKQVVLTDLREQAGISASYDRWLQESVALLERQHYLHCHGTNCTVSDSPALIESATIWQDWDQHKEQWIQNANLKAHVVLVETMLRALPAILTGKRPAPEIMFPNGSMELVEGIYQHNVITNFSNEVLARQVVTYVQERLTHERDARIRLLEIGAGTGGTTSQVLQMIHPYQASIAEYCYSDISEAFLRHGQQVYGVEYPYLTYRLFNVEKPLAGQGIEPGSYDLVIAANVLHATSSIRRTIRNAKAALKKRGLLLLNEITGASLFTHLTFGLLEGWWAYEDPELRVPGCPALTAENWQAVLISEGFGVIYHPTREMQEARLQVIVAESDGVVRQPPLEQSLSAFPLDPLGFGVYTSPVGRRQESMAFLDPLEGTEIRLLPEVATVPVGAAPVKSVTDPGREGQQAQGVVPTDRLREALAQMVASFLKIPVERIDAEIELSKYGIDSLTFPGFANLLNRTYQLDLTPALFFEHSTIEGLARYLQTTYAAVLAPHFASVSPEVVTRKDFAPEAVVTDDVSLVKASRTRIVREAVQGNRVLFLKAYNSSQED
jgi:hypothetical protein